MKVKQESEGQAKPKKRKATRKVLEPVEISTTVSKIRNSTKKAQIKDEGESSLIQEMDQKSKNYKLKTKASLKHEKMNVQESQDSKANTKSSRKPEQNIDQEQNDSVTKPKTQRKRASRVKVENLFESDDDMVNDNQKLKQASTRHRSVSTVSQASKKSRSISTAHSPHLGLVKQQKTKVGVKKSLLLRKSQRNEKH